MDFPGELLDGSVGALGPWAHGSVYNGVFNGGFASKSGYTANNAIYAQVFLPQPATLYGFCWINGGSTGGNVDMGLYDIKLNRLAHIGSTAQSGTSTPQVGTVGALALAPGNYYVAWVTDSTGGSYYSQGTNSSSMPYAMQLVGIFQQASAFPLPATAVLATPTFGFLPYFGALINTSVV